MRCARFVSSAVLLLLLAGCGSGKVDWADPENLLYREQAAEKDGFVELEYWSLLDAPCQKIYDALAAVEEYPTFIPGVDSVSVVATTTSSKTVQIAQRVIGRQTSAKVEWTFDPEKLRIDFRTLSSDLTYNDGFYQLEKSPDDTRCLVRSKFLSKQGKGLSAGAVSQATRESFMSAARAVRKRAGADASAG
ncbi:MAG: SRPBCC family protein [bacterium]|nr:SRPBCC family protein [bacterium]